MCNKKQSLFRQSFVYYTALHANKLPTWSVYWTHWQFEWGSSAWRQWWASSCVSETTCNMIKCHKMSKCIVTKASNMLTYSHIISRYLQVWSYQQKRKYQVIKSSGSGSQRIHCSTKPTMQYTGLMHFMITRFSLHHFLEVSWPLDPLVDATGNSFSNQRAMTYWKLQFSSLTFWTFISQKVGCILCWNLHNLH